MCPAFPDADYYEDSVTMGPPLVGGTSPLGDLAFHIMQRIETGLGCPLIP
jgi:hypothetical protein